ncbi:MAG TPA: PEFG-CTERM sorting domain-containing protein [Candidatus Nitrosotalea sp.]|nr:PEFG-CTERM sorting domain-containing protein [Candidatus Nitrosotalea sp.]
MLVRVLVVLLVFSLSLSALPSFAQPMETFVVKNPQGGESYNLNYTITGATINDMQVNTADTSIVILVNSTRDGNLVIDLPRSVIDAKASTGDDQFIVLVDDTYSSFHETKTDTDRTLTVPFAAGTQRIEVIGTQVVPEFGALTAFILIAAVASVLVVSSRNRIRFST